MPPFEYLQRNIFGLLHEVRHRPRMCVRKFSDLEPMIDGYYKGIAMHGIHEDVPRMTRSHFGIWLYHKTKWSTCAGWAYAIEHHTKSEEEAFDTFFDFVDQYRELKPTVRAHVTLKPHHQPTPIRRSRTFTSPDDRPDEIWIINYAPTRLHHFRFRYGVRMIDDWFHYTSNGSHSTRPKDLYEWGSIEFGIEPDEWTVVRNRKKSESK